MIRPHHRFAPVASSLTHVSSAFAPSLGGALRRGRLIAAK
jgi:hypothetical protein